MKKEIVVTKEQIEKLLWTHKKRNEMYEKAYAEGRLKTANCHLDRLLGIEYVLDVIGIEYED